MKPIRRRRIRRMILVVGIGIPLGLALWLGRSTVVLTSGGVYHRIELPLPGSDSVLPWRAAYSITADRPQIRHLQGPVIDPIEGGLRVRWTCQNRVVEKILPAQTTEIHLECGADRRSFHLHSPSDRPHSSPPRLAVVSDLEGDLQFFRTWGRETGVLDDRGRWAFGRGHLVVLGDVVDRGRWVYDLLWLLYHLEQEAVDAGGRLHLVLGNHEQYLFRGQTHEVETEHLWAIEQIAPYAETFESTTILGAWLRNQPILVKCGRVLYAHGGVSSALLETGLDVEAINEWHRRLLAGDPRVDRDMKKLLRGPSAPTQYRGYVPCC